jgi:hypothetical protein
MILKKNCTSSSPNRRPSSPQLATSLGFEVCCLILTGWLAIVRGGRWMGEKYVQKGGRKTT